MVGIHSTTEGTPPLFFDLATTVSTMLPLLPYAVDADAADDHWRSRPVKRPAAPHFGGAQLAVRLPGDAQPSQLQKSQPVPYERKTNLNISS
jgi:hypothetical protein